MTPTSRASRRPCTALLVGCISLSVLASPIPAVAQDPPVEAPPDRELPAEAPVPEPPLVPVDVEVPAEELVDARLTPAVAGVPVDSTEHDAAVLAYETTRSQLRQTLDTIAQAERVLEELTIQERRLVRQLDETRTRRRRAAERLEQLRDGLDDLAVASYISGGPDPDPSASLTETLEDATRAGSRRTMVSSLTEHQLAEIDRTRTALERATREETRTDLLLEQVRSRLGETTHARDSAQAAAFALTTQLAGRGRDVADSRITAWVRDADFQLVSLDAYVRAADRLRALAPACGLRWEIVAGISRVEGKHGTWRGSRVQADGAVTRDIIGIPLDGDNGTAVVRDSEGGALDGDAEYDRAVGPMQFLPTSWTSFGADGNDDGEADPQNLYDAALAAAGLLCRSSGRLDTDAGLDQALLRYNNSRAYVEEVRRHIGAYDGLELPVPA